MATSDKDRGFAPHACLPWVAFHFDACAGSVLTPHDYITNVQNIVGKRSYTGFSTAVCVDHSQTLNLGTVKLAAPPKPPEGTMLAFTPSLRTKTRGPRNNHGIQRAHRNTIQTADLFTTCAVPAARLWTSVWRPPMQQQPVGTQHKQLQIAKPNTTVEKSQTYGLKASCIVFWFGQQNNASQVPTAHNLAKQEKAQRAGAPSFHNCVKSSPRVLGRLAIVVS